MRLVPFTVSIPKAEQDKHLLAKLVVELPGILAWAVEGCLLWQREGLGTPLTVTAATEGYRREMDVVGDFISDCCVAEPGSVETSAALYDAFTHVHAASYSGFDIAEPSAFAGA